MGDVIAERALPNWLRTFASLADPSIGGDLDPHQDVWQKGPSAGLEIARYEEEP